MKFLTFGEIMLRLKSPGLERFFQSPMLEATFGGGEANVAVSLANYGEDGSFIDLTDYIYTGGSKTAAGKDRKVPMHHRIQPIAERYPHGFSVCYGVYYKWIKATGHTPHDTRHTFVSRLQTAGADHVCIERLVGHASHGVTDKIYTHKDIDELRRTVELLR